MSPPLYTLQLALLSNQARLPSTAQVFITLAVAMTKWDRYWRTRRDLKNLEPHLLKDVGLTRDAARTEAEKPFWRD